MKTRCLVMLISLISIPFYVYTQGRITPYDSITIQKIRINPIALNDLTIKIESGIMNQGLPFQSFPSHYTRIFIEPSISVFGFAVNSNIMLSTEDLLLRRNMNMFNFRIDRKHFQDKLIELSKRLEYYKRLDSLQSLSSKLKDTKSKINSKQQSEAYQRELALARATLIKAENDSIYNKVRKNDVIRSKRLIENQNKELGILDSVTYQISNLSSSINLFANLINKGVQSNEISPEELESYLNSNGKKYLNRNRENIKIKTKLSKQINRLSFLQNIRSFQFMDFNPNYSILAQEGISIRGLDFDWGNGAIYLGANAGYLNTFKSSNNFVEPKEWLMSGHAGIGDLSKSFAGIFLMKTNYSDSIPTSKRTIYENNVIGIQAGYKITELHEIRIEKLWSNFIPTYIETKGSINLSNSVSNNFNNSAILIKYKGGFVKTNTNVEGNISSCQPFFYSIGNPFLRRDTRRYDVKIEEKLFKSRLTFLISGRLTKDNISGMKSSSSSYEEYSGGVSYRFKMLLVKSDYKHVNSINNVIGKIGTIQIQTNTLTWFSKIGTSNNSLVLNHSYILNTLFDNSLTKTHIVTLVNSVLLSGGSSITLNGTNRYSIGANETISDSCKTFTIGLLIQKRFTRRIYGKLGSQFQKNLNYERRNCFSIGILYAFSNMIQCSAMTQVQFVQNSTISANPQYSGNINLIVKLFKPKSNGK